MKPIQERDVLSALSQRVGGVAAAELQTSLRDAGVPLAALIETVVALTDGPGAKPGAADRLIKATQPSPATKNKLAELTKALRSYNSVSCGEFDKEIPNGFHFRRLEQNLHFDIPPVSGHFTVTAHAGRIELAVAVKGGLQDEQKEWSFAKERGPEVLAAMHAAGGNTYAYRCVAKLLGIEP